MSLLLAIETSSGKYQVVLGGDGHVVFDSARENAGSSLTTLGQLVSFGLEAAGGEPSDIVGIAVNIGPGSLTYVRAGISFVNAFAYSLGVPIYPFNWFEIIAKQTQKLTTLPVLGVVPAAKDNAYVGLIKGTSVEIMRFGPLATTLAEVINGLSEVAVAGRIRNRVSSLLEKASILEIENPSADVLLELGYQIREDHSDGVAQVGALNDQSEIFYEPTSVHHP
jgi:tRNA threonylcarbamoyl adenosine modification protein YeaZ